jgi:hypothetical protein
LETLEDRTVPSQLIWTNRGNPLNDSDGFHAVFRASADEARQVVDAALQQWDNVILDLNNGSNTYPFTINATQTSGEGASTTTTFDSTGQPTGATINIQAGANGNPSSWFLDPAFFSQQFEGTLANSHGRFAQSGSAAAGKDDLLAVVTHEITHGLGFGPNSLDPAHDKLKARSQNTGVADTSSGGGIGTYWAFNGAGYSTLLTSFNSTGSTTGVDAGAPIHSAALGASVTLSSGVTLVGADDLMNPRYNRGERRLISRNAAFVLRDTYGYTVNDPVTAVGTFYAYRDSGGLLLINGSTGTDFFTLSQDPSGTQSRVNFLLGSPVPGTLDLGIYNLSFSNSTLSGLTDVETNSGGATVNIPNTNTLPIHLNGHGQLTVNVGVSGNAQGVIAPIRITNGLSFGTNLTIDDSADTNPGTVTVGTETLFATTFEVVSGLTGSTVEFGGVQARSATLKTGGSLSNTVTVNVQGTATTTNLVGNSPRTVVNVGSLGTLQQLLSDVNITNPQFRSTVNIDDHLDPGTNNGGFVGTQQFSDGPYGDVEGLGGGLGRVFFKYTDTNSAAGVTLKTGTGQNNVSVFATVVPIHLVGNSTTASLTVSLGNGSPGSLDPIQGALTLTGLANGNNILIVNDQAAPPNTNRIVTITQTGFTRTFPGLLTTSVSVTGFQTEQFNVSGTTNVQGTASGTSTTIEAFGTALPMFLGQVDPTTDLGTLQTLLGPVSITSAAPGPLGLADVTLNDYSDISAHNVTIAPDRITGLTPFPIILSAASVAVLDIGGPVHTSGSMWTINGVPASEQIQLDAPGPDTVNVQATPARTSAGPITTAIASPTIIVGQVDSTTGRGTLHPFQRVRLHWVGTLAALV